ncbi:hypothetical protein GCM10007147_06990 [Nocardiopsis kunsanensis]|uniref:FAD-dependent urate hydroxylase HpyO/Asp monooxygenase CreE-like FAD/NAD(P)-binding domain-containing protein n=1 Tax=Nocardiopsis kunsanensis TaxID=141693 RepID=A0A919CFF5_9ACTN|nr:FAD/NAD(P)-binding protein [Nocardiopsis kunsanensis]GHD17629.1 hypothetical protein GCM10007147_06990 [Nocardiopsis kunsanensis]
MRGNSPEDQGDARSNNIEIGLIGAGPRGLSILERLCANQRAHSTWDRVRIHVIDQYPAGAGAVWRADQNRLLLMNTVASQTTAYTDASVDIDGPIERGPSLYEWAEDVARFDDGEEWDEQTLAEARDLGPDSYPSRALYGQYLNACFRTVVARAPAHVEIRVHASRAVAMADTHGVTDGPQGLRLANKVRLNHLDAIVLAQGHLPMRPTPQEARTASLARIHHLTYITRQNPADAVLDAVEPGADVLLRGLGLNFFDYMALLTEGRGGVYVETGEGLVYRPSGQEPTMYAFSRRGVPYHARGQNQKGVAVRHEPRLFTAERIARLREENPGGLNFVRDLWPLIAREVEAVYYDALLRSHNRSNEAETFTERYLTADPAGAAELPEGFGIGPDELWDWERISAPVENRRFDDRSEFRSWLLEYLRGDVTEAARGNVDSPLKTALDVLRDLRNEVRLAVEHGGLEGLSHRDELYGWYTSLNAYLSIGPPVSRVRELIALIEAGFVEILGPGVQVRLDPARASFVAISDTVPGRPVDSRVLIEARLPDPDLRRTEDPLIAHLVQSEQAAPYRIPTDSGHDHETGGLTVTRRPFHLIDERAQAHPRRFAYGVPTESVHWVTAAGTRPGVDSVTLKDADAIARAALALSPAAEALGPRAAGTFDTELTGVIV